MNRKRALIMFLGIILFPALSRAGGGSGGDYDDGCGCPSSHDFQDMGRPHAPQEAVTPVVDKRVPPDGCQTFIDDQRNADVKNCEKIVVCPISAEGLASLKADNMRLLGERDQCLATKDVRKGAALPLKPSEVRSAILGAPVSKRQTVEIRSVRVKRGWNLGHIVEKFVPVYRADLDATVACNGFSSTNHIIYPRQIIKVCRFK